jgi:hypothetical protein
LRGGGDRERSAVGVKAWYAGERSAVGVMPWYSGEPSAVGVRAWYSGEADPRTTTWNLLLFSGAGGARSMGADGRGGGGELGGIGIEAERRSEDADTKPTRVGMLNVLGIGSLHSRPSSWRMRKASLHGMTSASSMQSKTPLWDLCEDLGAKRVLHL